MAVAGCTIAAPAGADTPIGQPLLNDEGLAAALNLDLPSLEKVRDAVAVKDFPGAKQAYLDFRRTAAPARWRVMPGDRPATSTETTDPAGDDILKHIIHNMYGFYPKVGDMGADFNWQYNPVPRGDPKFSSEWTACVISRMQFWDPLADAYWKTGDEKYAREWVAELQDFAQKNPIDHALAFTPPGGPETLWRTLDSAIRMHDSWPYAYAHFLRSPSFTPDAQWLYLNEIHTHGTRLAKGLADPNRSGNWVTTECFGLYTLAVEFPELKEAAAWQALAMDRMTKEVQRVVTPDGLECELSPGYHVVALEGFVGVYQLAQLNQLPVPPVFSENIIRMYRALVLLEQQNGKVVGTNDSSEVDVAPLAREAAKFSSDPLFQWAASGGTSGTAPPLSVMLPYAGFYVMRGGWKPDDTFLFFRGGPTGTSHQHEDMNEIVLRAFGHTFLPDPGNFLYDHSEWRRYVINSPSHNTVMVDGKYQHRGASHFPVIDAVKNPWISTPLFDYVSATYDAGYQENQYDGSKEFAPEKWIGQPDKSVSHTRRVLYLKPDETLIVDTLDGIGTHVFDAHFHLNVPAATLDPQTQSVNAPTREGSSLTLVPLDRDNLEAEIVTGQKEPMLGWSNETRRPAPTLRYRKSQAAPATFSTFLYPSPSGAPQVMGENLHLPLPMWGGRIRTPGETMEVALSEDAGDHPIALTSLPRGKVTAQAGGLVLRSAPAGSFLGGWNLHAYADDHLELALSEPGALVLVFKDAGLVVFNASPGVRTLTITRPFNQSCLLQPGQWTEVAADHVAACAAPELSFLRIAGGDHPVGP